MQVWVTQESILLENPDVPECAVCELIVTVDQRISERDKRAMVIHAVLENYFQSVDHDKIDEVCDLIQDGIDQLGGLPSLTCP